MSVSRASGEPVARYSFHAASTASGRTALPADWNGQRDALRGPEFFASRSANSPEWPLAPVGWRLAWWWPRRWTAPGLVGGRVPRWERVGTMLGSLRWLACRSVGTS